MKRLLPNHKPFFVLLLALFAGLGTAYAYDFSAVCPTGQMLYYNITDATNRYVEITFPWTNINNPWGNITKPTGDITLPSTVTNNGINYSVEAIGEYAFYECSGLTGILTIPNSVNTIGKEAFHGCSGFTGSLTIPNSVTTIGFQAFAECSGFDGSLSIPNSVTTIGGGAFGWCPNFTGTLTLPNSLTAIEDFSFYLDYGFTGSLTIPNSVTSVGEYAFSGCTGFDGSLTLSNYLFTIDINAFFGCSGFSGTLTIPSYVNSIGDEAFKGSGFTGSLTIPNSVTTIGNSAFALCQGFNGTLTIGTGVTSMGTGAFSYCSGLTSIMALPETPPALGTDAFANVPSAIPVTVPCGKVNAYQSVSGWDAFTNMQEDCPLIYSINPDGVSVTVTGHVDGTDATGELFIPETKVIDGVSYTVTAIGDYAFNNCSGLTGSLTIPNTIVSIGFSAFYCCTGFTGSLTLGNSVTTIGPHAFHGCTGFTGSLTIPNSVTEIGLYAFTWLSGLTGSLTIPNSITEIPEGAFEFCQNLSGNLILPNSLTTIGYGAFLGCQRFTGPLIIPNSVTTIGALAFEECSGFTGTLTIGHSVTSIGESAFKNCIGITQVQFNAINCGDFPFEGLENPPFQNITGTLSFGNHVQRIPQCMFWNCSGLIGWLDIPNSVTEIGYGAFFYCTGFHHLLLGNSVTTIGAYAFYYCSGLTGSLTIPESVTALYDYAFAGCQGFDSVDIGSNVSTINYGAFYECIGLTSMTVRPVAAPNLGDDVFKDVSRAIPVYIPYGSIMSYHNKEGWSDFTNYQYIPWTVTLTTNPYDGGNAVFVEGNGTYAHVDLCRVQATPNSNYQFMHWRKNGGICSSDANYRFLVIEDTEMEAVFMPLDNAGTIIGEGETTNNIYLPSYTMHNYNLSEQIYTADELGGNFTIYNISFFNAGSTVTRSFDIYLKQTDKTVFSGPTDWINATSSNMVYSGSVTMRAGMWTTIVLDTPFDYNADSSSPNLVLIVDDNTGDWDGGLSCRVFNSQGCQALRVYSDNNNYDPSSVSSYGSDMYVKNQIIFNRPVYTITATPNNAAMGTVTGAGQYGYGDLCQLKATANSGRTFLDWVGNDGVAISDDTAYEFIVTGDRTLTANFIASTDVCNLTFNLDNYDQGWGGNYLEVHFGNGMSHLFGVLNDEATASYTLPFVNGSHVVLNMQSGTFSDQCPFEVRYANGNLACTSVVLTGESSYEFDMDCDEMPAAWAFIGYGDDINNVYLPSYSYFSYTLSQQIYTANEIGTAGNISSIAFYNQSVPGEDNTKTRTYDIYLKPTNKFEFFNEHDWISVSQEDKVFSGSVTMVSNEWTVITFDRPFVYDGTSNLVLIMDDNTGDYTNSPHMACRIYDADSDQTLRVYSDGTNYDPMSPPASYGSYEFVAVMNVKNQVYFGFTSSLCSTPVFMTTTDITANSATLGWSGCQDSYNFRYKMAVDFFDDFENDLDGWTVIQNGEGNNNTDWHAFNASGYSGSSNHSGDYVAASFSWWGGSAYDVDNWLITPPVTLGGTLSFWVCGSADWLDKYYVCVSTTRPSIDAFTVLGGERYPTGEWTEVTIDLSAYAGQQGYIAIHHQDNDKEYLWIDDFGIYSEWEELNEVTSPVTIAGLAPVTEYVWQVQGNNISCDGGVTDWSELATFTTECGVYDLPYTYGFETENDMACWSTLAANSANMFGIINMTANELEAYDGNYAFVFSSYDQAYYYDQFLISPELNSGDAQVAVEFSYLVGGYGIETFDVMYSTTTADIDAFEVAESIEASNTEEWMTYRTTLPAGTKYVCLWYNSDFQYYLYVDGFSFTTEQTSITQTIELSQGTNWFSTYVDISLEDLQAALAAATPSKAITIKSQTANAVYSPRNHTWSTPSNFVWDVAKMYYIDIREDCEITLEGMLINPAEHPITIVGNGVANWIGYPFSESMTVTEAFSALPPQNNDNFKSSNGNSAFNRNRWSNNIQLEPGRGYLFISAPNTEDRIFTFPTRAK